MTRRAQLVAPFSESDLDWAVCGRELKPKERKKKESGGSWGLSKLVTLLALLRNNYKRCQYRLDDLWKLER